MYAAQNRGLFPHRIPDVGTPPYTYRRLQRGPGSGYQNNPPMGPALLLPPPFGFGGNFMTNNDVLFCPSDDVRRPFRVEPHLWGPHDQSLPVVPPYTGITWSMSYWQFYHPDAAMVRANSTPAQLGPQEPEKMENYKVGVKNPSAKMMYADQYIPVNWTATNAASIRFQYQNYHKEGANILYADGHAKWLQASAVEEYIRRNNYQNNQFYYYFLVAAANNEY